MTRIIKPGDRAFYINRNRYVETEGRATVGVEGHYTIRAIRPDGKVRSELAFPNLLTDLGLNVLGSDPSFVRMHLGTGTTPPDVSDTGLANFGVNVIAASGSRTSGAETSPPYFGWSRYQWTSAVGGATGTWTEIGISNQNTNGNLRSRALILDSGGNPTSFPVLSDEQFQGVYEFRLYAPASDNTESITLSGTSYDATTRPLRVTLAEGVGGWAPLVWKTSSLFIPSTASNGASPYTGGLAAVTAVSPLGSALGNRTSVSASTYGSGNHYLDVGARWGSGDGVGTVRTVLMSTHNGGGRYQIEYDPTFSKLTTEEFIHNQRISWARR